MMTISALCDVGCLNMHACWNVCLLLFIERALDGVCGVWRAVTLVCTCLCWNGRGCHLLYLRGDMERGPHGRPPVITTGRWCL